jgi:hypothetical protein
MCNVHGKWLEHGHHGYDDNGDSDDGNGAINDDDHVMVVMAIMMVMEMVEVMMIVKIMMMVIVMVVV